ncbi:MAG: amidinotransferase [Streptosporangiales bacterium]|nr:amidinotransferase [Streptosporangiales bacterium]
MEVVVVQLETVARPTPLPTARTARPRHYLMCPPTYFDVRYAINPWMDVTVPVDHELAVRQWRRLVEVYRDLGHTVDLIDPVAGLPDMVFAANGATVVAGHALTARFHSEQRAAEAPAYRDWLVAAGRYQVRAAEFVNEGEGDFLVTDRWLLAGTGFRSEPSSHAEAQEWFGRPVIGLRLVDPRFYHLDTALAVLDGDQVMYYPEAFSAGSRAVLAELFPDAILASRADAAVLGLNAVSDGRHVVLAAEAQQLAAQLADHEFIPLGVEMSELVKAGGSVKCCTLELRS